MNKIFIYRIITFIILALSITSCVFYFSPTLVSFSVIALTLGLRHGLDADHIVAIDNITRKLSLSNKSSATTGLYFALGHSTIVFCLTLVVVLGINTSHIFYNSLSTLGDQIGSLVSIGFLFLTIAMNFIAFKNLNNLENIYPGFIFKFANKYLFKIVDKPAKMFIVGFFFGLGFDTATEIALLSIAATATIHGFNTIFVLLLPILFACGMSITDTINSIFMSKIYNWINQSKQQLYLYNYLILSFATLATLIVAGIEIINLINKYKPLNNLLATFSARLDNNSDLFGASIILVFILLGIMAYLKFLNNRLPRIVNNTRNDMET